MEFSYKKIIIDSWELMKSKFSILILTTLFYFAVFFPINHFQGTLPPLTAAHILFSLAAFLFIKGLDLGYLFICLNIINKKQANFNQIFAQFYLLFSYILATIICLLITLLFALPGIIFLLITIKFNLHQLLSAISIFIGVFPAVYISLRLQFYLYFLIEEETTISAIKKSAEITKGYALELFILGACLSIIFLISLIPFLLGVLISFPLMNMATTNVYLQLKSS